MNPASRLAACLVIVSFAASLTPPELSAQPRSDRRDAASQDAERVAFFEKRIRPVLVKECYSCHAENAKEIQGGLTLDTREGIRNGGDRGPAVVPGDVKKSLILAALRHSDNDLAMPPTKKLSAEIIADFETWIAGGAADPRDGVAVKAPKTEIDVEKGRKFWAFQAPKKSAVPQVKDEAWPRSDIDRYLLAAMEAKGLHPVADADASTVLRRVTFDLIGLPPSPQQVEEFTVRYSAQPEAAMSSVVDSLLASPQFGERWGRHWLDVVRYAESSGRTVNFAYPHAWRYRDYVIASFNADKPYNQFVREQLAGDLLTANDEKQKAEFLVATGFLAIGPKSHDERNRRQFEMDLADEQIDATFQTFQALTVACARCHDHKFDPIPQKDYYALAGIFRSTETCYGTLRIFQSNHPSPTITLPKEAEAPSPLKPLTSERRASLEKQIEELREQSSKLTGADNFIRRILLGSFSTTLRAQIDSYESDGTPKPLAVGARDRRFTFDARLLVRGEQDQPSDPVRRGFPQVLTKKQPDIRRGSGRRELAEFLASSDNPLTARVMANRVWLHLVGKGLVSTPDNFGASGQLPSHSDLLDHLALSFVKEGWSVKQLIRTIVMSRAYRLSSQPDEKNFETDPDNVLVWRMPKRRLEAEALRDAMLAVGGKLDLTPPVGSSVARGGEGNVGGRFSGGFGGGLGGRGMGSSSSSGDSHRTIYEAVIRDALPESLTLFDFPDPSLISGERATTTVPAQSLYLMNNAFVIRQAEALSERIQKESEDDDARLKQVYLLCCSRTPSDRELETARKFLHDYSRRNGRRAGWTALCQAFFASAEFAQR